MGRSSPCSEKPVVELKKGAWTPEEDHRLLAYIQKHGHGSWPALPSRAGLQRSGKSCRLRWINYLRPDIKRGNFSLSEEQTIIRLHALLGNKWSVIATQLPKRTDNDIKNYWNTHIKKSLSQAGIDPITHKRTSTLGLVSSGQTKDASTLNHMAQWETARLEAEARLAHSCSKKMFNPHHHHHQNNSSSHPAAIGMPAFPRPQPLCLDTLNAWQRITSLSHNALLGSYQMTSSIPNLLDDDVILSYPDIDQQNMINYDISDACDQISMIVKHDIQNHFNILEPDNIDLQEMIKDRTKLHAMTNPGINCFIEGFTDLADNAAITSNIVTGSYEPSDIANYEPLDSPIF